MIKIEINGVEIEAEAGSMIIQVADQQEIPIPRFCYHRKLSIAANCRMCLVHVDKVPKPLPACATPITEGMKIWTNDKVAIDAQKAVMEFLLINHPLDCPICDQGGECELQDVSLDYGKDVSRFSEEKRVVVDKDLGSLIATDLTRCIQCTRCVRFGQEVAGERELGALGRGEFVNIGTFVEQNVNSELSGNIIDLCPVGALTSKPFRFKARAWELSQHPGIATHDCIGSNLHYHVRDNKVMRVAPRENEELNEVWLSDRDRFSYEALVHDDRLRKPLLLKSGKWSIVSWVEALKYAVSGLQLVINRSGANQLGVLASPSATLEEHYLLQDLTRKLGSNNIDHRLRTLDFSNQADVPLYPNLGIEFKDIETRDLILLVGCNVHKELPIAGVKIRKMTLHGGKVCVVNPGDFNFNFTVSNKAILPGGDMLSSLAGIAKELLELNNIKDLNEANNYLNKATVSSNDKKIAAQLLAGKKIAIILGQLALMHPQASQLISLGVLIATLSKGSFGMFSDGANAAGAWIAGCVPHRLPGGIKAPNLGLNAMEMLQKPLKAYVLFALEPEFDSILGEQSLKTLQQADFVIALSAYQSDALLDIADVILPIAPFAENSGTYINLDGNWQTSSNAINPFADSRPGWKVLRVFANLLELEGFEYTTVNQISEELAQKIGDDQSKDWKLSLPTKFNPVSIKSISRIAPVSLYAVDGIVRRATALQATKDAADKAIIQMNERLAKDLAVKEGDIVNVKSEFGVAQLSVELSEAVADQSVIIHQANGYTNCLGAPLGFVEISQ
jgi:NADH-quinone oxidoreductase subunit G